ncbi:unnamed protein product [Linum tenue]|jgi:drug/metabolite transporter (DMT)-like permease
MRQR